MSNTPRLAFPEISSSQATKEVTHNESLKMLDAFQFCAVQDKDLVTSPAGVEGNVWIVAGTGGSWSTATINDLAQYYNATWVFYTPLEGFRCYVKDEDIMYVYTGAAWIPMRDISLKVQVITPADAPTINWANGHIATCLLDRATTTFTFSGGVHGDKLILRLKQDGTGGRLVVFPATVRYGTDITSITLSTAINLTDYIGFFFNGDDTKYDVVSLARGF